MYIEYAVLKNSGGSRIISLAEDFTNYKVMYPQRIKALCTNIFNDLIKIITVQGYSGTLDSLSLSACWDKDRSDSASDGSYNSFLSLETTTDANGVVTDTHFGEGAFDSKWNGKTSAMTFFGSPVDVSMYGDATDCGYTCYTFLKFDTSRDPATTRYKYLFFQVIAEPDNTDPGLGSGYNAYASIRLYTSLCDSISEIDYTKMITTVKGVKTLNPKPSAFSGKSTTINFIPDLGNDIAQSLCTVKDYNTKAGTGAVKTNNVAYGDGHAISVIFTISMSQNHLYIGGRTVQDVNKLTTDGAVDYELTRYQGNPFVLTKYLPVDHWYVPELKTELNDYIPWAFMKTFDGVKSNNPNGQTLNMFVTSSRMVKAATSKVGDECLCKWSANPGVLSNGTKSILYNNVVSDKNKSEAVLLFGMNITTAMPTAVMTGLFSSLTGIYGIYGDGQAFGDVISAVSSQNELVNMKILPNDLNYQPRGTTTYDTATISDLKIAIPYG